jgi:pullulanase/glycogen debranching enzyme
MMKLGRHVDADGRARVCGLAHALVVLSQGVPFIHAGDDLLRSKSLDRDSYNSGVQHRYLAVDSRRYVYNNGIHSFIMSHTFKQWHCS